MKIDVNNKLVYECYFEKFMSRSQICNKFGVSDTVIKRIFKDNNWFFRNKSESTKLLNKGIKIDKNLLIKYYVNDKKSSIETAKILGVKSHNILANLKKYNIPIRNGKQLPFLLDSKGNKNSNYKNGNYVRIFTNCIECNKKVTQNCKSGYCKSCARKGNRHPMYKNITTKTYLCSDCGCEISYRNQSYLCKKCKLKLKIFTYCSVCGKIVSNKKVKMCFCCRKISKNNPNWRGGITSEHYPYFFNNKLKNKIRKRDQYICQNCGIHESEYFKIRNRQLDIHHIDYNKNNCKINNLITLCNKCNCAANGNRDYWYAYYKYIIDNKIYLIVGLLRW